MASPYLTAADIARIYRVPRGTVWRWAHEDGWRRTRLRPVRYHMDDVHTTYTKRRRSL